MNDFLNRTKCDSVYDRISFYKEVEKWKGLSRQELESEKHYYSRSIASIILLKIHRFIFVVTSMVSVLLFWSVILYMSWLPVTQILNWLSEFPRLAIITGYGTFCIVLGFIGWGLHAEDGKVLKPLMLLFDKWEQKLKEEELTARKAARRVAAISIRIKEIENDS